MTTSTIDNSQRTAAKVAGVAGLLAFVLVVFGNYVLLEPLIVPRNAADTARNILAHQTQFRVALICFITYGIGAIVLLTALYVVLAPVNRGLALAGALFRNQATSHLNKRVRSQLLDSLRCKVSATRDTFRPDKKF